MRVAIDGRTIVHGRSGVGNYANQIVRALLRLDTQNEYVLFVVTDLPSLEAPNLRKVNVEGYDQMFRNRWWENVLLPGFLAQHGVDVYFSPGFTLPLLPRFRSVVAPLPLPDRWKRLFNVKKATRYVVAIHDVIAAVRPETFTPRMRMWQNLFNRNAAAIADGIIVGSESTRRDFMRIFRPSCPSISVVPYYVEERFSRVTDPAVLQRVRLRYSLPERFVLFLGTIEPRKNLTALVRAYAVLPPDVRKQFPLVVCGATGWYSEPILEEIGAPAVSDCIRMIGFAEHEDLPALYSLATLFVYPSLYEGFGYPPLEAMACGVPVIASNTSSLPEVVGDAAITVDPFDEASLAEQVRLVLGSPQLQASLAAKGLERAKQFRWDRTARQTLAILEGAARNGRAIAGRAVTLSSGS